MTPSLRMQDLTLLSPCAQPQPRRLSESQPVPVHSPSLPFSFPICSSSHRQSCDIRLTSRADHGSRCPIAVFGVLRRIRQRYRKTTRCPSVFRLSHRLRSFAFSNAFFLHAPPSPPPPSSVLLFILSHGRPFTGQARNLLFALILSFWKL